MALSNRASIYNKLHKVLRKHYKPVVPQGGRSVLEQMLYACCLENSHFDKADAAYENVSKAFYDWNEVRVTTVAELSEIMAGLYDPAAAATRVKKVLQNVFESCYSFEIESLRKQNIGKAVKLLEKYGGTPFVVAYTTQHALAGHSIPKDKGALQSLYIVGAISVAEGEAGQSPGLERTISKSKGVDFASLLHQLAADFIKSPHAPAIRAIFLEITAGAKDRFPTRRSKKKRAPKTKTAAAKAEKKTPPAKKSAVKKKTAKKPIAKSKPAATKKKKSTTTKKKKDTTSRRISKRKPK